MNETYIDISKASSSSLVERVGASTTLNSFVAIKKIAIIKGLKSTRSIRIAIQKGKYIAREIKVNGGTSYEILYSSLEPEIQERIFGRAMLSDSEQAREVSVGRYLSQKHSLDVFVRQSAGTPNNPRRMHLEVTAKLN